MPGKSKHGKRKHFRPSKKSKSLLRQDTAASPATGAAVAARPAATAPARPATSAPAAPAVKAAPPRASVKTDQYAYVPGDLRRIGMLSGIIIVILFVLYFTLS
jgi:hypothetical protein